MPEMNENIPLLRDKMETVSTKLIRTSQNFSFLPLTESGISFCPENSVRFGRRAARFAPRGIDFSYVVPPAGINFLMENPVEVPRTSVRFLPKAKIIVVKTSFFLLDFCAPGRNRTHNYPLGRGCYIHLTTGADRPNIS